MHAAMRRAGWEIGRDQVARLMRKAGLRGMTRGKMVRTTVASKLDVKFPDLVKRNFTATRPNQLWVADITFVPTWAGFAYVAFVTDVYCRKIVGWNVSSRLTTESLPLQALDMASWLTQGNLEGLIHHADHGSQGGFNWSSQHPQVVEVFNGGNGGLEQEDQRCSRGRAPAVACRSGVTPADAFAGFAYAVAGGAAAVLASDRHGYHLS